ncbi:MAG: HPr family phosphocarrier protein [Eubacteriales bacterium]
MNTFDYVVVDEVGLHARPASQLVKFLEGIDSKVSVTKGEKTADAKRLFSLMGLAIKEGETITFTLEGENAPTDIVALEQFCKETF